MNLLISYGSNLIEKEIDANKQEIDKKMNELINEMIGPESKKAYENVVNNFREKSKSTNDKKDYNEAKKYEKMFGDNKVLSTMVDDIVDNMKSELGDNSEEDLLSGLLTGKTNKLFNIIEKTQKSMKSKIEKGDLNQKI